MITTHKGEFSGMQFILLALSMGLGFRVWGFCHPIVVQHASLEDTEET
jgi:hypothetical protein